MVCLAASLLLPPDGLGVTICWFKWLSGFPCPGCGLTRSVTCLSHLQFAKALAYHPFGPVVYGLFVANVVLLVLPCVWRMKLLQCISHNEHWVRPMYQSVIFTFLAFGVLRLLFSMLSGG